MAAKKVVVVIPALDEAASLPQVLAEVWERAAGWVDEIVVVDGGSADGTPEAAARGGARLVVEMRRGYGRALAAGIAAAPDAAIFAFMDADGSDDPADLPRLIAPVRDGQADLVLGTRLGGRIAKDAMPAHQRFGNWLAGFLIRRLYSRRITDLSPMRAVRAETLLALDMREMTYGWPTEMIVKAVRRGCRVLELPVNYRSRLGGKSKISGTVKGTLLSAHFILSVTLRHTILPSNPCTPNAPDPDRHGKSPARGNDEDTPVPAANP
ncbi:MAG: glycosyltransferase family 2 protein [Chloroflexi bacterium]|nr:glycosyltransferase family 2 protein [Chloroflexota bacterium]